MRVGGGANVLVRLCFLLLFLLERNDRCVDGRVVSARRREEGKRVIQLTGGPKEAFRRVKREAGGKEERKVEGDLHVHITELKDNKHNEAIVYWTGTNSKTVYVLTRQYLSNGSVPDSALWRSTNYGESFTEVKSFPEGTVLRYFYSCPTNKAKLLFVDTTNKKIFSTINEGENFIRHNVTFSPNRLLFHPTIEDHVLAYDFRLRELWVSRNLSDTWVLVSQLVNPRFYWAVPGIDQDLSTIHLEAQDLDTGRYIYKNCTFPYKECKPNDQLGFIDVESVLVENEYIFSQKSTQFTSDLMVSYNRGPFKKAYFPLEKHSHPQDFHIVNTEAQQVFLVADHQKHTVHLYLSDVTGRYYTLSLRSVMALRKPGETFIPDLYEVKGVNGTYIVNVEAPGQNQGAMTFITFDQGGKWDLLPSPAKDNHGKDTNCHVLSCSLHLHQITSEDVPYILSEDNAPGIIMAQGSIGSRLDPNKSSLFISTDGGLTWKMMFEGSFHYNILDHGGAIVAVNISAGQRSNEILYSCTEGQEWSNYTFSDDLIQVDGVLNEPGINTLITSIYGHLDNKSGWMIVQLDFSAILQRHCGPEDYYTWVPSDDIKKEEHKCILGQRLEYRRRKATSECFNGRDYEHAQKVTTCPCSDYDYECDFGYAEAVIGGDCIAESWFNPNVPFEECPEGTSYNKSSGYRKIASDNCEGGDMKDKYKTTVVPCPLMKPEGLELHTQNNMLTVATNTPILFTLTQAKGSKKSTEYKWTFGDHMNSSSVRTGFKDGHTQSFRYPSPGNMVVKVVAQNAKGSDSVTLHIRVQEKLVGLYTETPHGAHMGFPVQFIAEPVFLKFNSSHDDNNVHFLWTFGDEKPMEKPLLTYGRSVKYLYTKPGNYTAMIEAVNSVSSVFKRFTVYVYGTLATVQLTFDEFMDSINQGTAVWRTLFADLLKKQLAENILEVFPERLEVVVLPGLPTKADVSVLPMKQEMTRDESIMIIVKRIQYLVEKRELDIDVTFLENWSTKLTTRVVKSEVLTDKTDIPPKPRDYTAVYVCVPILVAASFVSLLVVMYYKRKFSTYRRYSVLQSHSADAEDTLLGDDDDDVPPLDPNPDHQGSLGDDEEFDIGQYGHQPALVMMTGTSSEGQPPNTVNC